VPPGGCAGNTGAADTVARVSPLPPWPAPLEGDGVRLRRFDPGDTAMVVDLATDPYVAAVSTLPVRADEAAALAWIERQHARWTDGTGFSFAVADAASDRALGQLGLWLDRRPEGVGSIGYLVAPGARGRGVARRALQAASRFAFTLPGIDRLDLFVEPVNAASLRTAAKAGYECVEKVPRPRRPGGADVEMLRWSLRRQMS
jgi:[ribosomal protein S5]-alanine N-acetyltransferase